ncbi:uncharacterized protein LOC111351103 [Spodoptera litura]|uniref:Uncharacterized protein LOC111351103 n=1 Tax=Spodoptera litura TaxID=69820 RepID=A0A9J7IMT3_SPOLT|nr:uncharacterized protein LOC111351103 [Spodoptera litura]
MTCICTKDGRWPHKSCSDAFQVLAPATIQTHKCVPDSYVRIDCNVCRCGPDGQIVNDRCTRNACEEDSFRRSSTKSNNVYSNCEVKNWYSLAPCQFCYCINENKLICNTGNYFTKKLELGTYNLKVCGKDLVREVMELVPENHSPLRNGQTANTSTRSHKARTVHTSAPAKQKLKRVVKLKNEQNIGKFEPNRESKENKTQYLTLGKEDNFSSSDEYYYDTDEQISEKPASAPMHQYIQNKVKTITTLPPLLTTKQTQLRLQYPAPEEDEINNGKIEEILDDEDDSSDTEDEVNLKPRSTPAPGPSLGPGPAQTMDEKALRNLAKGVQSGEYQYVGNTLRINLPRVLNKVFQLALRKSMVSLSSGSKCTPGTTTTNGCNSCFCLKNSKLLCTKNVCQEGNRTK